MPNVINRIQDLGDLGLACVLCLIGEQHGIVFADGEAVDEAGKIIAARCSQDLGLATVVIECSQGTDIDHFRNGILVETATLDDNDDFSHAPLDKVLAGPREVALDERRVADVVVARNLNLADYSVQIQALELMRSRRMYTHTAMHLTGKSFILIALNEFNSSMQMNPHLNGMFAISHHYESRSDADSEVQSMRSRFTNDSASMHSVLRARPSFSRTPSSINSQLGPQTLQELRKVASIVTMTAEVSEYLQNVIVTLRLHRYVAGGISALATRQLRVVAKALAVLHGLDFVTPAIVALAVRKVYLHRLILADDKTERSLRWGSDPAAVKANMQGVTVESAIDTVLATVQGPV